jgi:cation transport ATPase
MNDILIKAYDSIKEEQRNADSKAYLFIVLISAFLSFFNRTNIGVYSPSELEGIRFIYLIIVIALLLFVMSLIPIYRHTYKRFKKRRGDIEFNIFYWSSISNFLDNNELMEAYKVKYNGDKALSNWEKDLLAQIRVNAEIIERKIYFHKRAFLIIGQLILLFMISVMTFYSFKDSVIVFLIYFVVFEVVFIVSLFKKPKWLFILLQKL